MKILSAPANEEKQESLRSKAEEEDDEALSLCDLPVNSIKHEKKLPENKAGESQATKTGEDFDFGSWGGNLSAENPKMCVADEVFFKGQLLPLRSSVSSVSGVAGFQHYNRNSSRTVSSSESMDHGGVSRVTSLSSRSSSSGSGISSNSWSAITTTPKITPNSKPIKIRNNFHTHPSPNPQIRVSKSRSSTAGSRSQRLSARDIFRLGLIRTPEIELQNLKSRNCGSKPTNFTSDSRNSSSSSGSSSSDSKIKSKSSPRLGFDFFGGCKCSAAETVALNDINVVIKSSKSERWAAMAIHHGSTMDEKLLFEEMKIEKKVEDNNKREGKQALSRRRTFEWLKDLSLHAGYVENS